jgi:hypothetical protein
VADLFYVGEEIVDRGEADVALAEFAAGDDLGMEFVIIAEEKMLADSNLAARPDQTLPVVGIPLQLPCKQDLDTAAKEVARGRIMRTQRLGLKATTSSVEAGGKYARVIEDEEVAGSEEIGEIAKLAVGEGAGGGGQVEQTRGGAIGKRLLGD